MRVERESIEEGDRGKSKQGLNGELGHVLLLNCTFDS